MSFLDRMSAELANATTTRRVGHVSEIGEASLRARGLSDVAAIGDMVTFTLAGASLRGRVLAVDGETVEIGMAGGTSGLRLDQVVLLDGPRRISPNDEMLGRVIDVDGRAIDGRPLMPGPTPLALPLPGSEEAVSNGETVMTGIAVIDYLQPVRSGARLHLDCTAGFGLISFVAALAVHSTFSAVVWTVPGASKARVMAERLGREAMKKMVILADDMSGAGNHAGFAVADHLARDGEEIAFFATAPHETGSVLNRLPELPRRIGVTTFFVMDAAAGACDADRIQAGSFCFDDTIRLSNAAAEAGLMPPVEPCAGRHQPDELRARVGSHIAKAIRQGDLDDPFLACILDPETSATDLEERVTDLLGAGPDARGPRRPAIEEGTERPILVQPSS